jgi:hypothetical protein
LCRRSALASVNVRSHPVETHRYGRLSRGKCDRECRIRLHLVANVLPHSLHSSHGSDILEEEDDDDDDDDEDEEEDEDDEDDDDDDDEDDEDDDDGPLVV